MTQTSLFFYLGGWVGGSRRIPGKIRQDIKPVDELRKNDDGNPACLDAAAPQGSNKRPRIDVQATQASSSASSHAAAPQETNKNARMVLSAFFIWGGGGGGEGVGQEAFLEKLGQDTNITILYLRGSWFFLGGGGARGSG